MSTPPRETPPRGRTLRAIADAMAHAVPRALDDGEGAGILRRVAGEMADRLSHRGVRLTGRETPEALTDLLEAVEHFEAAVTSRGGDAMVSQSVTGRAPVTPDRAKFALPTRNASETVTKFTARVVEATARVLAPPTDR